MTSQSEAVAKANSTALVPSTNAASTSAPEVVEAVRYLVNTRGLDGDDPLPARIAVTASMRGEGVTTLSRALASMIADDFGTAVCWVDLSWVGSQQADGGGDDDAEVVPGIRNVLDGTADLGDVLVGDDGDASVIALHAGASRGERPFSSRSTEIDDVVRQLGVGFDHIVFDMPPILESSTALTMFRLADAYMFVILAGVTRSDQVRRATRQLAEVPLLGSVLNQQRVRIPKPLRRIGEE